MVQKRWLSYDDVKSQVLALAKQIQGSGWKPDYIVGLTRGGLLPAVMLSHWFGVPCETLKVSLRDDGGDSETNCWMSDDAFGYVNNPAGPGTSDPTARKNILIVDDINDSGATIAWIKRDWPASCMPSDDAWDHIWGSNVRFAVLVNNLGSDQSVSYHAMEINKVEHDQWIVFPWEDWWNRQSAE